MPKLKADLVAAAGIERESEFVEKWTGEILVLVPDTLQRSVKSLLFELFPGLRGPRTGTSGSDVSNWRNECRVCSSTVFDRYFLLAVPRNTLAETDVDRFFEVLDDREPVSGLLQDTIKLGKARALLERIDDRIQEMPESKIRNLVQLMADHSEELVFPRRSTSDVSYNIMPMLVIIRGIRKLETDDVRIQTCIDIIRDCKSLHTVARLVSWINSLQHEDQSDQIILDQKKLEAFRNVASERFRFAIRDGILWDNERLSDILTYWLSWDKPGVRRATCDHLENDENLLSFLYRFMEDERDGKGVLIQDGDTYNSPLTKLVDVERIVHRLKQIQSNGRQDRPIISQLASFLNDVSSRGGIPDQAQT